MWIFKDNALLDFKIELLSFFALAIAIDYDGIVYVFVSVSLFAGKVSEIDANYSQLFHFVMEL